MKINNLNHQKVKLSSLSKGQVFEADGKMFIKLDPKGAHINALRCMDIAVVGFLGGDIDVKDCGSVIELRDGVFVLPKKPARNKEPIGLICYGSQFETEDERIYIALDIQGDRRNCVSLTNGTYESLFRDRMVYPVQCELTVLQDQPN